MYTFKFDVYVKSHFKLEVKMSNRKNVNTMTGIIPFIATMTITL